MSARFSLRSFAVIAATAGTLALGSGATAMATTDDGPAKGAQAGTSQKVLLKGKTTASYFWDDGSGRAGDTGMPASGKPMQKGLAASPSWPLLTEGYVIYNGKKAPFFVGDRGPGVPSNKGIMLDLDAKTFADLTGGKFNAGTLMVDGNGGKGHIEVEYVITKWGDGVGLKNHPVAFSTGAWKRVDRNPANPPVLAEDKAEKKAEKADEKAVASGKGDAPKPAAEPKKADPKKTEPKTAASKETLKAEPASAAQAAAATEQRGVPGAVVAGGLVLLGGGLVLGRERIRKLVRR